MNKVILNDEDVIEQIHIGEQTFKSIIETAAEVMVLADRLREKKKKVKILVDLNEVTDIAADSLIAAADALVVISDSKMAIFGGKKLVHHLVNLVVAAADRGNSVKTFRSRSEAEEWLKKK